MKKSLALQPMVLFSRLDKIGAALLLIFTMLMLTSICSSYRIEDPFKSMFSARARYYNNDERMTRKRHARDPQDYLARSRESNWLSVPRNCLFFVAF